MATRKKIALRLLVIVAIVFAALLLLAPVFLNIDSYRPRIVSYFEEATGKKVEIERLALTLVPQPTIHISGFGVKSPSCPITRTGATCALLLLSLRLLVRTRPW